jgi:flagellar basal-body rod modification protein FlgD
MQVGQVGSTGTSAVQPSATSTAKAKTNATMDYNMFLKLLMAELKYQDPTSPNDPTEYVSQLASFSNVEQQVQTNTKLDNLLTSTSLSQASSIIGHTIFSQDGATSGRVAAVNITSSGATAIFEDGNTLDLGSGITII